MTASNTRSIAQWTIGIDAGGSKCKATLFTQSGEEIVTAATGSANLFTDFALATKNILNACYGVLSKAPNTILPEQCQVSIGAAGANQPSVKRQLALWQHPFARVQYYSDLHVACYGANEGNDCAVVIVGTGSSIAIFKDQQVTQFGGHGFLLGDQASGAWIGRKAVSWYLQVLEGLISESQHYQNAPLQAALAKKLGHNIESIIDQFGKAAPTTFAALAPSIIALQDDSPMAKLWVNEGLEYIVNVLTKHGQDFPVFIDGGLAHVYQTSLNTQLMQGAKRVMNSAQYGAFLCVQTPLALID